MMSITAYYIMLKIGNISSAPQQEQWMNKMLIKSTNVIL